MIRAYRVSSASPGGGQGRHRQERTQRQPRADPSPPGAYGNPGGRRKLDGYNQHNFLELENDWPGLNEVLPAKDMKLTEG